MQKKIIKKKLQVAKTPLKIMPLSDPLYNEQIFLKFSYDHLYLYSSTVKL